jgi:ATP synthase I chain
MNAEFYERALWRIRLFTAVVGLAGTIVLLLSQGLRPAAGFLAGAALSILNFRGLSMLASAIGGTSKPGPLAAVLIALRYVLIGTIIYVIVRFLGVTPAAVIWGLLAAFAAVILEILCELIFRIHG